MQKRDGIYRCDAVELFLDFIAPSKAFRSTRTPIWTYVFYSCFYRQSLFGEQLILNTMIIR